MINGYYDATGGMVAQFNRLNVISNNLANANTAGFKQDDIIIGDYERIFKNSRDNLPLQNNTYQAAQFINRNLNKVPRVIKEYTNFSLGDMVKTSNPLDLALKQKNSFFLIKTPAGLRLTRAGDFSISSKGYLVTKQGFWVLNTKNEPIKIPANAKNISINQNAEIYVDGNKIATLNVVSVENLQSLKKVGDTMWSFQPGAIATNTKNTTLQGYLEKSNINVIRQMTALIDTNRMVEEYQKVMTTFMDDLNRDAIEKLASVRA